MLEQANTNSGEPVNKCDICHQTFNTKTAFRHHLNIHKGGKSVKNAGNVLDVVGTWIYTRRFRVESKISIVQSV